MSSSDPNRPCAPWIEVRITLLYLPIESLLAESETRHMYMQKRKNNQNGEILDYIKIFFKQTWPSWFFLLRRIWPHLALSNFCMFNPLLAKGILFSEGSWRIARLHLSVLNKIFIFSESASHYARGIIEVSSPQSRQVKNEKSPSENEVNS